MTLRNLMKVYGGNACLTIWAKGKYYCYEESYDYYLSPEKEEEDFKGNNYNHYIPSCLARQPWWPEVKNLKVKELKVLGGGACKVELVIDLEGD